MIFRLAADLTLVLHLLFIAFVAFGAALVARWPRLAWLHVPAAVWGAGIEFGGWRCPLTPLEQRLRVAAGQDGYSGGFIDHYLMPLIYPIELGRELQLAIGLTVIAVNCAAYAWLVIRYRNAARR